MKASQELRHSVFSVAMPHVIRLWGLLCVFVLVGCGGSSQGSDSNGGAAGNSVDDYRLDVVCTVGMIADVAAAVAGDRAEVSSLMGSGIDPHLYKPTQSDIKRLLSADVIFYNGLLLEGKMTDALIRAATAGRKVHAVAEALDPTELLEPEGFDGHYDPHVWMDPSLWARTVDVVRDHLIALDPAGREVYEANAQAYRDQLERLNAYADQALASVPEDRRVLVTAHDAFNYFGRRFGYEVVGIQGISTESEAGVRDIERMVAMLVERGIPAVFVESTVPQKQVMSLLDGAKRQGHDVSVGGELFSDAMGSPGTYEGTYVGMIDHNVTTIARALGGDVPTGGMNGKLAGGQHGGGGQ